MFIGFTQVGGIHPENQDRILSRRISDDPLAGLIAVADGISASAYGASVARWLCERRLSEDEVFDPESDPIDQQVRQYLQSVRDRFCEEFDDLPKMLSSGACLSVAAFCGDEVHCFWVGDCPIYETFREEEGYRTKLVTVPDVEEDGNTLLDWFGGKSPFNLKHVQLSPETSIVTVTSDGLVCDSVLLNTAYQTHGFTQAVAEELITESLTNPYADDVSIVAAQVRARSRLARVL